MTDSLDTSDREAEEPRQSLRLPVREMRDEPLQPQPANPLRAALQLALEATPEELPAGLDALRGLLAATQQPAPQPVAWQSWSDRYGHGYWPTHAEAELHSAHDFEPVPLAAQQLAPHPDDAAVDVFAAAMKAKLAEARAKGRSGWQTCPPEELSRMLREHVEKGDPCDVANFAMFLWSLGHGIAQQPAPAITTQRAKIPMATKYFRRIEPDDTEGGAA